MATQTVEGAGTASRFLKNLLGNGHEGCRGSMAR